MASVPFPPFILLLSTPVKHFILRWNLSQPCCDSDTGKTRVGALSEFRQVWAEKCGSTGSRAKADRCHTTSWGVRKNDKLRQRGCLCWNAEPNPRC